MKKYLPYILCGVLIAVAVILFSRGNVKKNRKFDDKVTLLKKDKIPYGTYVAYNSLHHLFPNATITTEVNEPGFWDSLSFNRSSQALIIVTDNFSPDESEMERLITLVENGNDVFISSMKVGFWAEKIIKCDIFYPASENFFAGTGNDSLTVSVSNPAGSSVTAYSYPGRSQAFWFYSRDTLTSSVLGYDDKGHANFIHLRAGKGNLYLHLAPLAFSNYFLLHKNNFSYYEKAFSYISPQTRTVVWDEYFIRKKDQQPPRQNNYLSVLMNMENEAGDKPFRAALWLLLVMLLVYTLMEMRRRQRAIPVMARPRNESLDFVKTIGRLYHDKGDHHNLSRKMAAYFLEHVRSRYKLSTGRLDEEFITSLSYKTGIEASDLRGMVTFISNLANHTKVTDQQLVAFHQQLETFYKKA